MSKITAVLVIDGQLVKKIRMTRKSAKEVVRKNQGCWRDHAKNLLVLYPRNAQGGYDVIEKNVIAATKYVADGVTMGVYQCLLEQVKREQECMEAPVLPLQIPKWVKDHAKTTYKNKIKKQG